ncbi:MAG: Arginyl-tRNA ligase ArgS [Candidatus Shapirobacteria bacterium GW2011_GWE1_38_10]|uniref:Arginine--tRNA ligase n=1 Tax=Candidatus Shapirobacteria bacterium GW2011_GWE1_38_10 TaxID=1618488 RepID=A0A0G0KKJ6_9BACT|nr:MAG: Arginyl-tRNA ligase ArgS [Candidatus Shapirobacteria bacterium GW2011_GWF2_37_20]KKQ49699.1 MAG: Arginyl-tRNA ligase ArgS [Candidatus Shapirobacteria bacterium GW2011_GWE1_38_10]KKQ62998.1 MAG: Arginyl-tRNA ligase ArgS [Candidatus Shapirobacteria bacterium GW2011_GWF1_38_23]HBP50772.1 arginine--tRNA ligase [Candidatus Shapirobacteria bacterium]
MIKKDLEKWLNENKIEEKVEHPSITKFGDYAIRTGKAVENLTKNDIVEKTEFMAGFTNIWLNKSILIEETEKIGTEEWSKNLKENGIGKTMVIDYSAPNIAKPFGIGHLRSTNIGQAIYNIYQILGWKCIGDNHLGDWGTQFGKLIVAIKKWGEKAVEEMTIEDLENLYVKFHSEAEKDEKLDDEAREWFSKLENKDLEATEMWQKCIDISIKEFDKIYGLLGVRIDYALGESFYLDKMDAVVKLMEDKNIIRESEGAKIIEFKTMPPAMAIKSNGTTTYFLRDMATVKYRMETWNPDLIIYEIGADQELHCRQVFETSKMLGWTPQFYNVAHGMIRWKDGKFSTRKGQTIHLSEVIDKAMEEAKKIAPDNDEKKIKAVAIGAIKFNDLNQDPKKDIIFDWEKVMSMEGNSGPYLQYTYARCQSVLSKSQKNAGISGETKLELEEENLLREFYKFEEKIIEAAERFSPAVVAEYLINLARKYNEFYAKFRVIGEEAEEQRLFLTERTASILKLGLTLLGIETMEKM